MKNNKPFAEVIESSLHGFMAQSWQWDTFPTFGSLVVVEQGTRTTFGVVHQIQTGSMDPMRYPFPYQKTEEELTREQPQIFEFLKTTFSCICVGYLEKGKIAYALAGQPVKIHSFVSSAPADLSKQFFYSNKYLHVLFGFANQIAAMDELLLAMIRQQAELELLTQDKIKNFVETFSLLTGNDYRRLKIFLQRVEPLL
jgi:hypothetical protein